MGEMERPDPSRLRVSDADRHRVAEWLRDAAGEGRLDLDELDERLEATYSARTYADLVPLTLDLPVPGDRRDLVPRPRHPSAEPAAPAGPAPATSLAMMSGVDRKGVWTVGERHTAVVVMGGATIDLRQAHFTSADTTIYAHAIMGGVDVVVNARTRVVVDGLGIMGAFDQARDKVAPQFDDDSPVVRVTGLAMMGGVTVTRKQMPGEPKPKRRELPPR